MSQPYVITIILNTNRRDDTLACIESLLNNSYQNHKVIVLDNASTDGSVAAIREQFPAVEVEELRENKGYAGNNNVGIALALAQQADWVFVLNEDTVLDPDCLARLVAVGQSQANIGMVGPMVYHFDEPDVIQSAGGRFTRYYDAYHVGQNETDQGQYPEPRPVDWISGCALLVRRPVIEQLGMLDDRFFIYWEETEWCWRTRQGGWQIMHAPQAKLWHKGVQRNYQPKPSVTYYYTRNRFLMLSKHRAPLTAWLAAWGQTLRTLASWSLRPKWRHKRAHRDAMWRGVVDFLRGRWGQLQAR